MLRLENVHENGGFRSLEGTQAYDAGRIDDAEEAISALTNSLGRLRQAQASAAIAGGASGTIDMSAGSGLHRVYLVISTSNASSAVYDYVGLMYLNTQTGTTHVLDVAKGSSANITFTADQYGVITATNNMNT